MVKDIQSERTQYSDCITSTIKKKKRRYRRDFVRV